MATSQPDPNVLELYKLSVEMADRTSARRLATNTFFVTLQTAFAALVGILGSVRTHNSARFDKTSLVALAIVGLILSVAWWMLLRYYRRLNSAKFAVINSMEANFPVKPFTEEWEVLHPSSEQDTAASRTALKWYQLLKRARSKEHREATVVEQVVPVLFAGIYLLLGVKVLTT
jgi:hypothetical protein